MLEQLTSLKPREIPGKAAPMNEIPVKGFPKGIPVTSMPYRQAMSVKGLPEVPKVIPMEEREWTSMHCV